MSGGHPRSPPSSSQQDDNTKQAHPRPTEAKDRKSDKTHQGKVTDKILDLIQAFHISGPTSSITTRHPTSPLAQVRAAERKSKSPINASDSPGPTGHQARSKATRLDLSINPQQHASPRQERPETPPPLPIGTERKLAMVNRNQKSYKATAPLMIGHNTYNNTSMSSIDQSPHDMPFSSPISPSLYDDTYVSLKGLQPPIPLWNPASEVPRKAPMAYSNQEIHRSTDSLGSNTTYWQSPTEEAWQTSRPYHSRNRSHDHSLDSHQSDDWRVQSRGFDPWTSGAHPVQNLEHVSSRNPGERNRLDNHKEPPQEEYSFSELLTTPGFGGYAAVYEKNRRVSDNSPNPRFGYYNQTYQAPESPPYPTTRSAQQVAETNFVSQGPRRSSVPGSQAAASAWARQNQTYDFTPGMSYPHRDDGNGQSGSGSSRHPSFDHGSRESRHYSEYSPTYRFDTPGPERQADDHRLQQEYQQERAPGADRSSWPPAEYNNEGMLPPGWSTIDPSPPGPIQFAPGDWFCSQNHCGYHNFQKNSECRACGHPRPVGDVIIPLANNSSSNPPLGSVGDWRCGCGYINWRRRALCKNCYPDHPTNQDRAFFGSPTRANSQTAQLNPAQHTSVNQLLNEANGAGPSGYLSASGQFPGGYHSTQALRGARGWSEGADYEEAGPSNWTDRY